MSIMKFSIILLVSALFFIAGCASEDYLDSSLFLTDVSCDAFNSCPEGYECASFSGIDSSLDKPVCYPIEKNPCDFVTCASGSECTLMEAYPVQVACSSMLPSSANGDDMVSSSN